MKKTLLILTTCIIYISCLGQSSKQYNIWYFGDNAGIDFNSGSPIAISGGQTSTIEGVSGICDTTGSLLFYTDGITVWNKGQAMMTNGSGLNGNFSSTQSALIVPQPGSKTIYYIFTTDAQGGPNGLCYSIVDMTQSGGLGSVTTKNIQLQTPVSEKVTASKHANGTDVWIVSHDYGGSTFSAYLLSAAGLNLTPVLTSVGSVYSDAIGYMKISPDGTKIASSMQYQNTFELYDFDNSSGIISNPVYFPTTYVWTYGVEFSPDSKRLYGSKYGNSLSEIYQFDLTAGSPSAIVNSAVRVGLPNVTFVGALQLGPDGKIYVARYGSNQIGVITNPDTLGIACNYVDLAVTLVSATCQLGLPNCYPGVFFTQTSVPPVASFQASDTAICENSCLNFTNLSQNATSYKWFFNGASPDTSTDASPQNICYLTAGNYNVTLIASNVSGSDTLQLTNYIKVSAAPPTPVIIQHHDTLYCSTDTSYSSYQWYSDTALIAGATDTTIVISHTGNYNVQVANKNGCKIAVGINIVLGIQNYNNDNIISLSPNPATIYLTLHTTLKDEHATVSIMNVMGQEALPPAPHLVETGDALIDVSKLAAGVYFVGITGEHSSIVAKFIKQ